MKAINLAYELLSDRARGARRAALDRARGARARAGRPAVSGTAGGDRRGAPYRWEASPPPGLTLDPAGTIEGRPAKTGSFPFTLKVTDRDGRTAQRVFVLHVEPAPLRLAGDTLPNATIGVPYEAEIAVEGGVAPLYWSGEPPPACNSATDCCSAPRSARAPPCRCTSASATRRACGRSASSPWSCGRARRWATPRSGRRNGSRTSTTRSGWPRTRPDRRPATRARIATLERRLARRRWSRPRSPPGCSSWPPPPCCLADPRRGPRRRAGLPARPHAARPDPPGRARASAGTAWLRRSRLPSMLTGGRATLSVSGSDGNLRARPSSERPLPA